VSFHVGSGCQNVGVYADAIAAAREAFDMAASYGFNMELLDIGECSELQCKQLWHRQTGAIS
jgi:diaminopimelate decarboxylase